MPAASHLLSAGHVNLGSISGWQFDTSTAMVVQKPNGLNSNRRSQNINKICFSHQVLLPALGWGTCRLPPHFHTHHVPRVRLADAARAASFTIFFEFGFLFFLRSTLDRIRLPQCGASVTTCLTANPPPGPLSFFYKRFDTSTAMVVRKPCVFSQKCRVSKHQ